MQIKNFKNIMRSKKTISYIRGIIDLHADMQGAYFWRPPSSAPQRRAYERERTHSLTFKVNGVLWEINQVTDCSCKNIYYSLDVRVDGNKKNVRALKKLIGA